MNVNALCNGILKEYLLLYPEDTNLATGPNSLAALCRILENIDKPASFNVGDIPVAVNKAAWVKNGNGQYNWVLIVRPESEADLKEFLAREEAGPDSIRLAVSTNEGDRDTLLEADRFYVKDQKCYFARFTF